MPHRVTVKTEWLGFNYIKKVLLKVLSLCVQKSRHLLTFMNVYSTIYSEQPMIFQLSPIDASGDSIPIPNACNAMRLMKYSFLADV